jgi:hypothetical protein
VAVTTTHSRQSLAVDAPDLIVDSLEELTVSSLDALFAPVGETRRADAD